MIIDLQTKQIIPPNPKIAITQSLVKSAPLINKERVDFNNQNNDWKEIRKRNYLLTPIEIIKEFSGVLAAIISKQEIDPSYCNYMFKQCQDWEESDQFTIIE